MEMKTNDPSVARKIDMAIFRDWIMSSVAPPAMREDVLARIEHFSPEDLSEMIDIVHQAELSCLAGLHDFHQNVRRDRLPHPHLQRLSQQDSWQDGQQDGGQDGARQDGQQPSQQRGSGRPRGSLSAIVYAEISSIWDQRIKWLQEVRQYLLEEQRRYASASAPMG
jgi:hypothetical protein